MGSPGKPPKKVVQPDYDPTRPVDVGDQLGMFVLTAKLGKGGVATVFRARHTVIGHDVAIKVLNPEVITDQQVARRFFQEALMVRQARHPNIVEITDLVSTDGQPPFMVMEFLEGWDLATFVRQQGALPVKKAVTFAAQMCDALAAVHARGVVHRDLKPENIFVIPDGAGDWTLKLLDFGIAKFLDPGRAMARTQAGLVLGTPQYMAPEQIRGRQIDARSDVYAVGIVLFEMLTGKELFGRGAPIEVMQRHLNEEPPRVSTCVDPSRRRQIPTALDLLVMRCLAKDPEDRIQTAAELKTRLQGFLDPTSPTKLPQLPPLKPVKKKKDKGEGVSWVAVAIGLGAAMLLGAVMFWLAA